MKPYLPNQSLGLKTIIVCITLFSFSLSLGAKQAVIDDSDGDGLSDQYENKIGTEAYLSDTDGDGINDGVEVGKNLNQPLDTDGDKRINALDYDDDNDGLPSILESKVDTDKDGMEDYLDTDSDNDGIDDGIEAGMLNQDLNNDFIDDAFDADRVGATDKNGDGIDDNLKLPDHNNDGTPDYLDSAFSKKLEIKVVDKKQEKALKTDIASTDKKAKSASEVASEDEAKDNVSTKPEVKKIIINKYTDSDNDGLLDTQEKSLGTNPLKRDSDNDTVSDAIEIGLDINAPQDSDHDGIIDALDPDDDNDGVLTKFEDVNKDGSPINDDTDDDGVPDFLDANDDGDGKLTLEEGSTIDTDGDGILDYLDKNDGVKDSVKVVVKNEPIPDEPEVVVLYDGNAASLGEEETIIDSALTEETESIAEVVINEVIENNNLESKETKSIATDRTRGKKLASSWSWQLF